MLTPSAAALLAVVVSAASTKDLVTGAFGLEFSEPVTDQVLAASIADPPYPLPPGNLEQTLAEPVPGEHAGWYLFIPQARPELLDAPGVTFMVLRNRTGYPVRILAEHPSPDCAADMVWLTRSLARKYRTEDDPFGGERTGFRHTARFVSDFGQVDVSCGPSLLIEYTDPAGYGRWLAGEQAVRRAFEAQQQTLDGERTRLTEARDRQLAELFTAGDRHRLEGALGVTFGEPVAPAWLRTDELVPDEPLEVNIPQLPEPVRDGTVTVTVGPDGLPVRVAGEFADPDGRRFDALARALRAKYGAPMKDTAIHRIHKINGDYLVVRYDPERHLARLVFIDDEGRRLQREREEAAKQMRLAEQARQFDEETAGL